MSGGHSGHGEHGGGDPLEEILEEIAPEKVADNVIKPHRKIRNSFRIEEPAVGSYEDFTAKLRDYVKHHWKEWYKGEIGDEEALGHAHDILETEFEREGGFKHAYKLAQGGKLDEVINRLSGHFEAQAKKRYITHHIRGKIDPTDLDAQTEFVGKIFDKYKALLPKGKKLKKPEYYAANHAGLIQMYSNLVDTFLENYEEEEKGHGHGNHGHGGGHP